MKNVFFSICIPHYHYENFIEDAVKSIYAQNYDDFEIIICDQGDTDSSFLLSTYDKVKIIRLEKPCTYNARCELIKHVSGDYFWQIDADDFIVPNALSDLNRIIQETGKLDLYFFRKRETTYDEKSEEFSNEVKILNKEGFLDKILVRRGEDNFNEMSTKCVKVIKDFSYEEKHLFQNEDGYLLMEVSKDMQDFVFIDTVYYLMRKHGNNISKSYSVSKLKDVSRYFSFMSDKVDKKYHISTLTSRLYEYNNHFIHYGVKGEFNKKLWKEIFSDKYVKKFVKKLRKNFFYYYKRVPCKECLLLLALKNYRLYKWFIDKSVKTIKKNEEKGNA